MIPKGMKVGDTFEDGGVMHEVTAIVNGNYESRVIGGSIIKDVKVAEDDYNSLPYAQLKKLCAERGLNAIGTKADLVARLEG